jgi:lipoprotein NlpI
MLAARDFAGCLREIDALLRERAGDRDTHLTRGLCAAGRGDYASALIDYGRALELDSNSVQALYYRGVARSQTDRIAAGIEDFSRAIAINPSYAVAYGGRATALRILGDNSAALADLTRAIKLDPTNAPLHHARGCVLYDMRNFDAARTDFQRAIELEPRGQPLTHARLWLIDARGAAAQRHDLAAFLDRPDVRIGMWEAQILEFLLARRSEEELMTSARAVNEPAIEAERQTQANFYAGTVRLLKADREGARRLFERAIAAQRKSFSEYFSATVELQLLASPSQ